jgi:glycosyltransferase involved in cell wall biosynthesis
MDLFSLERQALRRAMLTANVDVVHAHWSYEFAMAAIESGLPSIVTCHDAPEVVLRYSKDLYRVLRYFLARRVLSRATHVSAVSPYLKERIAKYSKVPVQVVPNPVVMPTTPAVRGCNRLVALEAPRLIMVINGWTPRKNARPALLAFAAFRERTPGAALTLVGKDFEFGGAAHTWASRRGIAGGMTFLGAMPHLQLLRVLEGMDLLVHPALEETFGMAIAESMARGVPVVGGANSGAVPWLIGQGGITCDVSSPRAIAEAISQILRDVETHQRYRDAACREIGDRFAASGIAAEYENLYRCCLTEGDITNVALHQAGEA